MKNGFETGEPDNMNLGALTIPIYYGSKPLTGKVEVTLKSSDDLTQLQDILEGMPFFRRSSPYRIIVRAAVLQPDAIIEFETRYTADTIAAMIRHFGRDAVIVRWSL